MRQYLESLKNQTKDRITRIKTTKEEVSESLILRSKLIKRAFYVKIDDAKSNKDLLLKQTADQVNLLKNEIDIRDNKIEELSKLIKERNWY